MQTRRMSHPEINSNGKLSVHFGLRNEGRKWSWQSLTELESWRRGLVWVLKPQREAAAISTEQGWGMGNMVSLTSLCPPAL